MGHFYYTDPHYDGYEPQMYTWAEGMEFPVNKPWALGFWFRKWSLDWGVLFDNRDDCYLSGAQIGVNIDGSVYAFIQGTDYSRIDICNGDVNVLDGQWHFIVFAHRYVGAASCHYLWVDGIMATGGWMVQFEEVLNYAHYFFSFFDGNTSTQQGFSYQTAIDGLFYMEADVLAPVDYVRKLYNSGKGVIYTSQDLPPGAIFANCDVYSGNSWDGLTGNFWSNANGPIRIARQYFQGVTYSVSNGIGVLLPHINPRHISENWAW